VRRERLAIIAAALTLAGCGSSVLPARELRIRASRVCTAAIRRSDRIAPPRTNTGGATFLAQGIAIFRPELSALRRLSPPRTLADPYRAALTTSAHQLGALIAAQHALRSGDDPVVAIKHLELELTPINARAMAAWRAVGAPVCANSSPASGTRSLPGA
jgi:hypothetical protein